MATPPLAPEAQLARAFRAYHGFRELTLWSQGAEFAAIATMPSGEDVVVFMHDGDRAPPPGLTAGRVTRVARLDLDEDGWDELLVWSDDAALAVMTVKEGALHVMLRRAWLLDGARDEAAVRARLARLQGFIPPAAGVSARDVLLSLQVATDDQIRSVLDPRGVSLCEGTGDEPPRHRCKTLSVERWTDKLIDEQLFRARAFPEDSGQSFGVRDLYSGTWAEGPPRCDDKPSGSTCSVSRDGSGFFRWVFVGSGARLRLRELDSVPPAHELF